MSLISKLNLIARIRRGKRDRQRLVESHLSKTLAYQVRGMRESEKWTQKELADAIGSTQNAIYRLELPTYGRATLSTLRKIAAAFDVALVVRFVPFSELIDWVSGTPRLDRGLSTGALVVPSYAKEEESGVYASADDNRIDTFALSRRMLPQPAVRQSFDRLHVAGQPIMQQPLPLMGLVAKQDHRDGDSKLTRLAQQQEAPKPFFEAVAHG